MIRQFKNFTDPCNNSSVADYVTVPPSSDIWRTLMAVYLGAILFLSLTFNGTLCLLFYKKTHLLSISNCFVLNLTACQLCKYIPSFILAFSYLSDSKSNSSLVGDSLVLHLRCVHFLRDLKILMQTDFCWVVPEALRPNIQNFTIDKAPRHPVHPRTLTVIYTWRPTARCVPFKALNFANGLFQIHVHEHVKR